MKKTLLTLLFICSIPAVWSQNPIAFAPTSDISGIYFGMVVDIDGDQIIASTQSEVNSTNVGKVYLFGIDGDNVTQQQVFYPDDVAPTDGFGYSLSIQNDFIALGCSGHDAIASDAGAVYLYRKVNAQYEFFQKLTVADGAIRDFFGSNVRLYNDNLFIAANGYGLDESFGSGAVYVYHFDGTSWVFSEKLTVPDTNAFGRKIEVEGDKLVIASDELEHSIHTFHWDGTHWAFSHSLGTATDHYFSDFSLSNSQLFLLSSYESEAATVRILTDSGNDWTEQTTITLPNGELMCTAIDVDGDHIYVGSNTDWSGLLIRYPVFHYLNNGTTWEPQTSLFGTTESTVESDAFGFGIASNGGKLVIGAPYELGQWGSGKAYYFNSTLSRDSFDKNAISVYPNPTSGILKIKANPSLTGVNVFDISGKLLISSASNSKEISLQHLQNGIYFVQIQLENGNASTFKIIKN